MLMTVNENLNVNSNSCDISEGNEDGHTNFSFFRKSTRYLQDHTNTTHKKLNSSSAGAQKQISQRLLFI